MTGIADDPALSPLVSRFVRTLLLRVAALQRAGNESDWEEVASLAHQMAGAAGGYGFPELGEIATRIEALAKSHPRPGELARSIDAFDSMCTHIARKNLH
jgi:HPt (histidine-containing phosphotransfer) domain-containing protein